MSLYTPVLILGECGALAWPLVALFVFGLAATPARRPPGWVLTAVGALFALAAAGFAHGVWAAHDHYFVHGCNHKFHFLFANYTAAAFPMLVGGCFAAVVLGVRSATTRDPALAAIAGGVAIAAAVTWRLIVALEQHAFLADPPTGPDLLGPTTIAAVLVGIGLYTQRRRATAWYLTAWLVIAAMAVREGVSGLDAIAAQMTPQCLDSPTPVGDGLGPFDPCR